MTQNEHTTAGQPSDEGPVRVLYVMGCGHSGSTVLASILGNHPRIQSLGEIGDLSRPGCIKHEYCACGRRVNECYFWGDVLEHWQGQTGSDDIDEYAALVEEVEGAKWRFYRLASERPPFSSPFGEYARRTGSLLRAVRTVSGRSILVDSSKRPFRAFALSLLPEVDLRVVHLVRDGRGVCWSLKKSKKKDPKAGAAESRKPRPVWRSALSWMRVNLRSASVLRRLPMSQVIQVRYEDFVGQPEKVLDEIGRLIDVDLSGLSRAVADGQAMENGHIIAGNRLRMAHSVQLRPDLEWISKMSLSDRRVCWALSGWLLRRYGYSKYPAGAPCAREIPQRPRDPGFSMHASHRQAPAAGLLTGCSDRKQDLVS